MRILTGTIFGLALSLQALAIDSSAPATSTMPATTNTAPATLTIPSNSTTPTTIQIQLDKTDKTVPVQMDKTAPVVTPVVPVVKEVSKEPAAEVRREKDNGQDRFYSRDYLFSIAFPMDWELAVEQDPSTLGAIGHKADPNSTFRENVLVGSFDLGGDMSLTDYFNGNLEYLKEKVPGLVVVSQENLKFDNHDAIKVVYTSTIDGKNYKTIQVFVIKNGRGFIITAMDEASSFDTYIPVFDSIIKSFRFE